MKSTTTNRNKSTLRRAFNPGLAREIRTGAVQAIPRIGKRNWRPIPTEEELFGPAVPCGYCGEPTEEFFLRSGLCPDCQSFAHFCTRNGHSAC